MNEIFRQEKKYLITISAMRQLSHSLSFIMQQDTHNTNNGYNVRSLYFDSWNDRDYEDKISGVELRRKIRLRIYDPQSPFALLEMKQKQGIYQKKRSLRITKEDSIALSHGHYHPLLNYPSPFALECYGLMQMHCYRPKTLVEYHRKAFVAKENNIRITFDYQIRATESSFELFDSQLNTYPVFNPSQVILEVKYNNFLMSYIKDTLNCVNQSELSVSKYCLARSAGLHFTT